MTARAAHLKRFTRLFSVRHAACYACSWKEAERINTWFRCLVTKAIAEASQLASPMLTVRMRATGMQEGLSCQKDPEQLSLLIKGALVKDGRCTVSPR